MAAGPIKRFRYRLEYGITVFAAVLLRKMGAPLFSAVARALGGAAYHLGISRKMALENLRRAFPEKSEAVIREIAKASYKQFGESVLEIARMPILKPQELLDKFEFNGLEKLSQGLEAGKGMLCMSGHYGSWELMGAAVKARGFPLRLAMGTQSNPWVDQLFIDYRMTVGIEGIRIGDIRKLMKALKNNEAIAILQDQDGDKWGIFTNFFGQYASTYTIADLLARKTGAAMVFGVTHRLGNGKHQLDVHEIPLAPVELNATQASAWRLQKYNDLLEVEIRQDPTQWLWMHHRWKAKPFHRLKGEDRRRAEANEIYFDTQQQCWRESVGGATVSVSDWK